MNTSPSTGHLRRVALVAVLANLFLTFADPYPGDQRFWMTWIGELQKRGFAGFDGNYPPLYVLWLWTLGKSLQLCDIPLQRGFLLKFLCIWPVYFGHLALLYVLHRRLETRPWQEGTKRAILWACALNPALLAVGPDWGQVDLLPTVFVVASLIAYFSIRFSQYALPLFVVSLLTKFQMIAFLPVVGALQLRGFRRTWKGIPISFVVILAVLLPFIATGNIRQFLDHAYVSAADKYKYATYNAANLWMLVVGNKSNWDTVPFMHHAARKHLPLLLLTSNYLGKILFALASLVVFVASLRIRRLSQAAMLSTLMGVSFFFLLPGMHERYLIMAVPISLLWLALDWRAWPWALLITTIAGINVSMLNGLTGELLWRPLSLLATVTFVLFLLRALLPEPWSQLSVWVGRVRIPRWTPEATLVVSLVLSVAIEFRRTRPVKMLLTRGDVWVDSLPVVERHQEYEEFKFGTSVDGSLLRIGDVRYRDGIGTHAPSRITFRLPKNARAFHAKVGLDEEASNGRLAFIVLLDDVEIWRSHWLTQKDKPANVNVNISGGDHITLVTDPGDSKNGDHADWVEPRVRLDSL